MMDPILSEIYSTVLGAASYVIGAYLLIWLILLCYILFITFRIKKVEQELDVLAETIAYRKAEK